MDVTINDFLLIDKKLLDFFNSFIDLTLDKTSRKRKINQDINEYVLEVEKRFNDDLEHALIALNMSIKRISNAFGLEPSAIKKDYKGLHWDDIMKEYIALTDEIKNNEDKLKKSDLKEKKFTYKFQNNEVIINEKKYEPPYKFPKFKLDNLIDISESKKIAKTLLDLYNQKRLLATIIKSNIQNYFEFRKNQFMSNNKDIYKDLENDSSYSYSKLVNSFKEYYKHVETKKKELDYKSSLYKNMVDEVNLRFFRKEIYLGDSAFCFPNYSKYSQKLKEINDGKFIDNYLSFPISVDITKEGNIFINTDSEDENIGKFVHRIIMQFISSAPLKKTNLYVIDIKSSKKYDFSHILANEYIRNNNLLKLIIEERDIETLLADLKKDYIKTREKLGISNCENLFDYNEKSETTFPYNLIVITGYPSNFSNKDNDYIKTLMDDGKENGYYFLIVNNTSLSQDKDDFMYNRNKESIEEISKECLVIDYSSKNKEFKVHDQKFIPLDLTKVDKDSTKRFYDNLNAKSLDNAKNDIIYLENIFDVEKSKKPYSLELNIPVGKNGNTITTFDLNCKNTGQASAILAGASGSGKSSFLHTIILSGAYNYSPDELEFYLVDFKDGVEFSAYQNNMKIPHVSFISLKNKIEDAFDILSKIQREKERRNELFNRAGNLQNIYNYENSDAVKSGKFPHLKRLVVIIDEYQNFLNGGDIKSAILSQKCQDILTKLLKETRSAGISIILSSQEISIDSDGLNQINNRYIFQSDSRVINTCFSGMDINSDKMHNELSKEKGLAYKTNDKVNLTLFKAAYSGETNSETSNRIVSKIKEKYYKYKSNLIISRNEDLLPIYKSDAPFNTFNEILDKNNYSICIGQSALSNDLVSFNLSNSEFTNHLIVGDIKKARNIEASIGLAYLNNLKCKNLNISSKSLYYFDLNNDSNATENPSIFETYKESFKQFMSYVNGEKDIVSRVNEIYEEFKVRKEKSKSRQKEQSNPLMIILNSYFCLKDISIDNATNSTETDIDIDQELDSLDSNNSYNNSNRKISLIDIIKEIYEEGYRYNIFTIIQDRNSNLFKHNQMFDLSKVICLNKEEASNCYIDNQHTTANVNDLYKNYVILFSKDIFSKVRPFVYEPSNDLKEYIDSFIGGLK